MSERKEVCICSAIVTNAGEIIKGYRHKDCFEIALKMGKEINSKYKNQGFVTSFGRFVSREEGFKLQKKPESNPQVRKVIGGMFYLVKTCIKLEALWKILHLRI